MNTGLQFSFGGSFPLHVEARHERAYGEDEQSCSVKVRGPGLMVNTGFTFANDAIDRFLTDTEALLHKPTESRETTAVAQLSSFRWNRDLPDFDFAVIGAEALQEWNLSGSDFDLRLRGEGGDLVGIYFHLKHGNAWTLRFHLDGQLSDISISAI